MTTARCGVGADQLAVGRQGVQLRRRGEVLPNIAVKGRQWLKKLPEDSFVLEHKTFARVRDAQAFIRGKDYLVNARIAPVYKDGQDQARFVVVTGYFRTKERAKNTVARLGLPSDVTVTATALAVSQSQPNASKP